MQKTKIFLLPGFGENHTAYNALLPYLKDYDVWHVDYRVILEKVPLWNYSGMHVAKRIIEHYDIRPGDKLIGHSTGGYFSFLIREILHNEICMISGFSDRKKVVIKLPYKWITTPLLYLSGVVKTDYIRDYMTQKIKDEAMKQVTLDVMNQFKTFRNTDLFKLSLIVSFDESPISVLPNPLRIHAKNDRVVRTPDAPFVEVKGGHFPLVLDTENVIKAMSEFLRIED
ncbi:MAG: alpha/beta hydrolase [Chitinophagales bacterium]|nr:alpha/beta hydrolase [Chitinophagales bacterium]